jgi:hypothetical protein
VYEVSLTNAKVNNARKLFGQAGARLIMDRLSKR